MLSILSNAHPLNLPLSETAIIDLAAVAQHLEMDVSTSHADRVPPSLETLPPELLKLIVSYLAPLFPNRPLPGDKQALMHANLAHRCLHLWATEYLFRDMVLKHAVPGMASHLELFTADPDAAGLQKYVKSVIIQASVMHIRSNYSSDLDRYRRQYVGSSSLTGQSPA